MAAGLTWPSSGRKLPASPCREKSALAGPCSFPWPLLSLSMAFVYPLSSLSVPAVLLSNIWSERGTLGERQMGNYLNLLLISHSSSSLPNVSPAPRPQAPNHKHPHLPFGPLRS